MQKQVSVANDAELQSCSTSVWKGFNNQSYKFYLSVTYQDVFLPLFMLTLTSVEWKALFWYRHRRCKCTFTQCCTRFSFCGLQFVAKLLLSCQPYLRLCTKNTECLESYKISLVYTIGFTLLCSCSKLGGHSALALNVISLFLCWTCAQFLLIIKSMPILWLTWTRLLNPFKHIIFQNWTFF